MKNVAFTLPLTIVLLASPVMCAPTHHNSNNWSRNYCFSSNINSSLTVDFESALSQQRWGKVVEILESNSIEIDEGPRKILLGHARLACNDNNISLAMFSSVIDLKSWSQWANNYLKENPNLPVALYLSGDAKARSGEYVGAIKDLSRAIDLDTDFSLAYNARGVIKAISLLNGEAMGDPKDDFSLAISNNRKLADAYVNFSTFQILHQNKIDNESSSMLNNALFLNNKFSLAHNSLGYINFILNNFDLALENFKIARSHYQEFKLFTRNVEYVLAGIKSLDKETASNINAQTAITGGNNISNQKNFLRFSGGHNSLDFKYGNYEGSLGIGGINAHIGKTNDLPQGVDTSDLEKIKIVSQMPVKTIFGLGYNLR